MYPLRPQPTAFVTSSANSRRCRVIKASPYGRIDFCSRAGLGIDVKILPILKKFNGSLGYWLSPCRPYRIVMWAMPNGGAANVGILLHLCLREDSGLRTGPCLAIVRFVMAQTRRIDDAA